jgi:hypothetical protein
MASWPSTTLSVAGCSTPHSQSPIKFSHSHRHLSYPSLKSLGFEISQTHCILAAAAPPQQVSMPVARVDGLPVGLSLIGPPGSDESLLELAERIQSAAP